MHLHLRRGPVRRHDAPTGASTRAPLTGSGDGLWSTCAAIGLAVVMAAVLGTAWWGESTADAAGLVAEQESGLAAAYRERYSAPRRALAVEVLVRAQERGQVRADIDPEVVVDQLWGAGYHRLLIPDQPLTTEFVDALVRTVMAGIRPGPEPRP